jgi:hypothetical protein
MQRPEAKIKINFPLLFHLSFRSVHALSQFLLYNFLLTPIDKASSQVFI